MINRVHSFQIPLLAFFLGLCSFCPAQEHAIVKSKLLLSDFVTAHHIPGLSITVTRNDSIIWSEGFGYANLELKEAVDPATTKFRIGSVSKTLTAAAIGILMDQDKLDLDAPIQQYVPSFPTKKWKVSLRHLAGHLGGIRHYRGTEFLSTRHYASVKEGLDIFKNDPLLHKPGTKYSYSSYGWNLISVAIENITITPFLKYMEQAVFKPLQMKNTVPDVPQKVILHRAGCYELSDKNLIENAPFVDNSYKWAGGGFLSTTEDLVKFGKAFIKSKFLDTNTMKTLMTPQATANGKTTNYGLGWRSYIHQQTEWYGHGGSSVGGSTIFMISREKNIVVAIVANLSDVEFGNIHFTIAENFIR